MSLAQDYTYIENSLGRLETKMDALSKQLVVLESKIDTFLNDESANNGWETTELNAEESKWILDQMKFPAKPNPFLVEAIKRYRAKYKPLENEGNT